MCSANDDMTNPFMAEPGTYPHDGTVSFYDCPCDYCATAYTNAANGFTDPDVIIAPGDGSRPVGGWVHRAALGTLPTFCTLQTAYAYLPEKE